MKVYAIGHSFVQRRTKGIADFGFTISSFIASLAGHLACLSRHDGSK